MTHLDLSLPTRITGELRTFGFLTGWGRPGEYLLLIGMVVGVGKGVDGVHGLFTRVRNQSNRKGKGSMGCVYVRGPWFAR